MIEALLGIAISAVVFFVGYFIGRVEEREAANGIGEKK